jgi:hypothetical protein
LVIGLIGCLGVGPLVAVKEKWFEGIVFSASVIIGEREYEGISWE